MATPKDVLSLADKAGAEIVDLRFCDIPGLLQHFSIRAGELSEQGFETGYGFDGSSIRGFQEIQESDMVLVPDPEAAYIDPLPRHRTLAIHCWVVDPVKAEPYSRDPRYVARKAERYLAESGIAASPTGGRRRSSTSSTQFGSIKTSTRATTSSSLRRALWATGAEEEGRNLGYKPRYKQGYFPVPPMDHYQDLRSEMLLNLAKVSVRAEVHHHEVGTAGQAEIDMGRDTLVATADNVLKYKYVVKNTAWRYDKTATFMPKPIFDDNGSGMHVHQSLSRDGEPLFWDAEGYGQISELARWYIGGLLAHAPALLAFCAPTTNSYRRLVSGFEAPINLVY
jgi:glutamine synthetase